MCNVIAIGQEGVEDKRRPEVWTRRLGDKRQRLEKMLFIVHERKGIYAKVWGRRSGLEEGEVKAK